MDSSMTELLSALNNRIFTLISLMAFQVAEGKTLAEAAPLLKRLGLSQSEIATVLDSTSHIVSVRLAEAKKKRNRGTGPK